MEAHMEHVPPSREEQEPLFTTTSVKLEYKSCGDWGVATGTGGGYHWECLVTSQLAGDLGVHSFRECCSRCGFQPYDCVIIRFVK